MKLAVSVPEAAEALSLSEATVFRLIARGELPAVTVVGKRRIKVEDLKAYLDSLPKTTEA